MIKGGFCKKTDIVFVSRRDGPFERGYKLLIGAGFSVLDIPDEDLAWNSTSEAEALLKQQPDVLILDRLSSEIEWMNMIKSEISVVISFDDNGSGAIYADVVINGILHDLSTGRGTIHWI